MSEKITLREYLEKVIDGKAEQFDLRFKAADQALRISEKELAKELEHLNKLREEVTHDRGQFLRMETFDFFKNDLEKWKSKVDGCLTTTEARYDARIKTPTYLGVISIFLAMIAIIITLARG